MTDKQITDLRVPHALHPDSTTYEVTRSPEALTIHFRVDTTQNTLLLQSQNSFAFWFNVYNYCIGMLVDHKNPKRYGYPTYTYLQMNHSAVERHRFPPTPAGTTRFSLGYSPVNVFSLASPKGRFSAYGPFGLEIGLDYFYKPDRYLSLSLGGALGFPDNTIAGDDYKTAAVLCASLRNNYNVGSFDLGYGVSISALDLVRNTVTYTTHNVGFGPSLSAQYRISDKVRIGLFLQSDLLNRYQQYVSATFCWKLPFH